MMFKIVKIQFKTHLLTIITLINNLLKMILTYKML